MTLSIAQRQRINEIARGRSHEPLYLLEGPRAVKDALGAGHVAELWLRNDLPEPAFRSLSAAAEIAHVRVGQGTPKDFDRLGKTVTPQGVLALVRDTERSLAEVCAQTGLLLWLDGVQNPGNVGAVVRVAIAFGATGLLVGEGSAHPLGLKALRSSAGLALRVPFARGEPAAIAAALGERPVWVLDRAGDDVFALGVVPKDLALVVGAEGQGPGDVAQAAACRSLGIRMADGVDSLNAAVAAGIAVAALRRTR